VLGVGSRRDLQHSGSVRFPSARGRQHRQPAVGAHQAVKRRGGWPSVSRDRPDGRPRLPSEQCTAGDAGVHHARVGPLQGITVGPGVAIIPSRASCRNGRRPRGRAFEGPDDLDPIRVRHQRGHVAIVGGQDGQGEVHSLKALGAAPSPGPLLAGAGGRPSLMVGHAGCSGPVDRGRLLCWWGRSTRGAAGAIGPNRTTTAR